MLRSGAFGQSLTRVRVEPEAIRLTHRLKWKRQYGRIPDEDFKIHVVVLNFEVSFFLTRIREKFLELDFDGFGDVNEASPADALVLGIRCSGDEDALVNGLKTYIEVDLGSGFVRDDAFSPLLFQSDRE